MRKEIIINAAANETRSAITEDGRLAEIFVENPNKEKMVGDIYLGRVAKVMPGIKAAFIDLGIGQDGFLHFSDIGSRLEEYSAMIGDEEDEEEEEREELDGSSDGSPSPSKSGGMASIRSRSAGRFHQRQGQGLGMHRDHERTRRVGCLADFLLDTNHWHSHCSSA